MDIVEKLMAAKDFHTHYEEAAKEIISLRQQLASLQPTTSASRVEEREAWLNIKQEAEQAKYQILNGLHSSDCSVHNEPAYPNGPCDCILSQPTSADEVLIEALRKIANAPLIEGTSIQAIATDALSSYKPTEG